MRAAHKESRPMPLQRVTMIVPKRGKQTIKSSVFAAISLQTRTICHLSRLQSSGSPPAFVAKVRK